MKQAIVAGLQWAMASRTGHSLVAALEGETAVPVMIKFLGQPIHRHMAAVAGHEPAIGSRLVGKLVTMDILVAPGAVFG